MRTVYQGTIRNGTVVFDAPAPLAEGTIVRVEPINGDSADPAPTSVAPHFHPVGAWGGPPGEFDRLLEDVRTTRGADLELERDAWK
jgi:hypothetical protein